MTAAPDVDRVLDRMGRSAFGYRSFPRPEHEMPPPPPEAVVAPVPEPPPQQAASAAIRFPLIAEALPGSAAAPTVMPPASVAAPAMPRIAPAPPPAAAEPPPPNPFLPRAQAAPPRSAVACTSLAGMFRLLSGRADSARQPGDGMRPREDVGAGAPAFPFRHG